MTEVKTGMGTIYQLHSPTSYTRIANKVQTQHTCIAWGAVEPIDGMERGEGALVAIPLKIGSGVQMLPVRIMKGKVQPGRPLCFMADGPGGQVRLFLSGEVTSINGQIMTPEGAATELPPELKKLFEDGEGTG